MNIVSCGKNIGFHFWVPSVGLVAKMPRVAMVDHFTEWFSYRVNRAEGGPDPTKPLPWKPEPGAARKAMQTLKKVRDAAARVASMEPQAQRSSSTLDSTKIALFM